MEGEVSVVDASTLCNRASGESRTPPGMPAGVDPTRSPDMPTVAAAGAVAEEKGNDEAAWRHGSRMHLTHQSRSFMRRMISSESSWSEKADR